TAESRLVLATVEAPAATAAVERVLELFPAERLTQMRALLATTLRGVVAQALCLRQGHPRVAAFEVMMGTSSVANLIREGKTYQLESLIAAGRKEGMVTLNESLSALATKKLISPQEAYNRSINRSDIKPLLARLGWQADGEL